VQSQLDPCALIGMRFRDRYEVEAFAGVGRFSTVYRAKDTAMDRAVALRLLKVKDTLSPSARTIVGERLRALTGPIPQMAGRCPALADVIEATSLVTSDGRWMPVILQTWVEGETLESVLVREKAAGATVRSLPRAIDLLTPVADALGYAHARGLVHGSLAPRNLFVRDAARQDWSTVEILDLGIAQVLASLQDKDRPFPPAASGRLHFFAPAHGSPEHFAGGAARLGPASDVFALALIVVELVCGVSPLGDGDDEQLRAAAIDPAARPTPRTSGRDLGSYVEAVFARALAVDPRDRYASVSAFWEALRAAARVSTLRPSSSRVRPAAPVPTRSRREPVSDVRELLREPNRPIAPGLPRESKPPPGFFESPPPSSIPGTNPLFAGEPRGRAQSAR
jgi:serine/threonine protein kinase